MVEFHSAVKHVKWEEVGGFTELKEALLKQIVWPITHPQTFAKLGLTAPSGTKHKLMDHKNEYFKNNIIKQEYCCMERQEVEKHTWH